jgi:hypothetical protein
MRITLLGLIMVLALNLWSQEKFQQLGTDLPTPNSYRTASGAPGHEYWQQKADYNIKVTLEDAAQRIYGEETITYLNNSPDKLSYFWLQLDQNMMDKESDTYKIRTSKMDETQSVAGIERMEPTFEGGYKIQFIKDVLGKDLKYTINKTMMRVELPTAIGKGQSYSFKIKWWYNINDRMKVGGRSGYEYFAKEDNYIYTIAQFFPRMCVYDDVNGWQNKQFLGSGEFALTFGDYNVEITLPDDHLVAATGELQNSVQVLTKDQLSRYEKAKKEFFTPVIIATQDEALTREKTKSTKMKTWKYKAINVRDFAFASSRKFIWDAMSVKQESGNVLAMSMYPKEGNPLWERYSTRAVAHTLKWYSHYTFDYPYPVAWSISTDKIGMEYPMICFNGGRCEEDGTYTERTKYATIGVIIHEVGHNYFPMIVNSDERQWSWMDEGLNSFLQYLTEQQWERNYPFRRGPAPNIVPYMSGDRANMTPIMANSESIHQFGNNAYAKPATALNILRETIMGRELFDYSFKEYANRWKFKSPAPADFFRTMEDASSVDLDWFWKGWFYTTEPVDLSINEVKHFKANPINPTERFEILKKENSTSPEYITNLRNKDAIKQTYAEMDTTLVDFYSKFDKNKPDASVISSYESLMSSLSFSEKKAMETSNNFYEMTFENVGGLPMPIILEFEYVDGSKEKKVIPAEIWKMDDVKVSKVFVTTKEIKQVTLDPNMETADINTANNVFPKKSSPSKFDIIKERGARPELNPMQKAGSVSKP